MKGIFEISLLWHRHIQIDMIGLGTVILSYLHYWYSDFVFGGGCGVVCCWWRSKNHQESSSGKGKDL